MKSIFACLVFAAALLFGCASPFTSFDGSAINPRDEAECAYEAEKATAGNPNPFDAGWNKAVIVRRCLELRGYQRR